MKKIVVELDVISQIIPEAEILPFLPRKKKKRLKKKISNQLLELAMEFANTNY